VTRHPAGMHSAETASVRRAACTLLLASCQHKSMFLMLLIPAGADADAHGVQSSVKAQVPCGHATHHRCAQAPAAEALTAQKQDHGVDQMKLDGSELRWCK
jgi:hypothetical protein